MQLAIAVLCVNCDEVFEGTLCPRCLNKETLLIGKLIEERYRDEKEEECGVLPATASFLLREKDIGAPGEDVKIGKGGEMSVVAGGKLRTYTVNCRYLKLGTTDGLLYESDGKGWTPCAEVIEEPEYCDGCHYLSCTEEEQQAWLGSHPISHRCIIHKLDLHYCGQHPKLPKPPICTKTYKRRSN